MKTLIIDTKDPKIKVENNTIIVNSRRVPFNLIDNILIFSSFNLNSKEITKITNAGKTIILVDYKLNSTIINSTKAKNSEFKLIQYKAYFDKRLEIAKYILELKIKEHISHLKKLNVNLTQQNHLEKIENAKDINSLLGIEGSFSKLYFDNFFTNAPKLWHNNKRTKRPPKDPLNALLSFGYTLYYNHITIKLIATGFEPYIGFLHTPFRDHNALSSDILEPFRADINDFFLNIIKNKTLLLEDFTKRGGVYLRYEGRKKLYKNWQLFIEEKNTKLTQILYSLKEKFYE
jgi:CRISPR-associated protein Cas1